MSCLCSGFPGNCCSNSSNWRRSRYSRPKSHSILTSKSGNCSCSCSCRPFFLVQQNYRTDQKRPISIYANFLCQTSLTESPHILKLPQSPSLAPSTSLKYPTKFTKIQKKSRVHDQLQQCAERQDWSPRQLEPILNLICTFGSDSSIFRLCWRTPPFFIWLI